MKPPMPGALMELQVYTITKTELSTRLSSSCKEVVSATPMKILEMLIAMRERTLLWDHLLTCQTLTHKMSLKLHTLKTGTKFTFLTALETPGLDQLKKQMIMDLGLPDIPLSRKL